MQVFTALSNCAGLPVWGRLSAKLSTFLLFVLLVSMAALMHNTALYGQTINRKWHAAGAGFSLQFANSPIGAKFVYTKDTLRFAGNWHQSNDTIYLSYKFNGLSTDTLLKVMKVAASAATTMPADTTKTVAKDSLAAPASAALQVATALGNLPLYPILKINNLSADALQLTAPTGQALSFSYTDNNSAFNKILNNSILRGLLGIFSLVGICYVFSRNRKAIHWRTVISAIVLQGVFAVLVLKVPFVRVFFEWISGFFVAVLGFTKAGSGFLFGDLLSINKAGYIFVFQVLPTIIFFSALSSLLYYLGVLQKIVGGFAWVMSRFMKLSGAESLSAAGNIFLGQTESPLLIKPYVSNMTNSELLCVMVGGMATIAGGVFAAYVGFLGGDDPEKQLLFATHLLTASIMSAPAAIMASKILMPETEEVASDLTVSNEKIGANLLDAIANGTTEGLKLAVNVAAMLLVFIALVAMLNSILFDIFGYYSGLNEMIKTWTSGAYKGLNLQFIFGLIGAPLAWLMGAPTEDIMSVGRLLGEKTIINEFLAYTSLGQMKDAGELINQKSIIIALYALCGFSNFGSIGIQLGGIGSLAPNKRPNIASMGLYALLGGSVACFMTAAIAGMLY